MGIEGVSINQLRAVPERNSNELNSAINFNSNSNIKAIDGLAQGQKVDPDKQNEHEKPQLKRNFSVNEHEEDETEQIEETEVVKYDLSRAEKYSLVVDDETNEIVIIEKTTKNIIQKINADELSSFVSFLPDVKGAIVNRKF